ncbi:MAG TPA: alpha/beta fold hydrolase [Anaerolineales bacterium]|nr:alpha/beta fold hydrolase [Anaerolineales bacterium]
MTADRDPAGIMPGAEPFFFRGGAVGCLVLHGWTGSTQEVRALGAHLATQGYTVFGPRLTHHGTAPADKNRSCWWDWCYSALDGWHILNALCEKVAAVGLSMGGAMALALASQQPVAAVAAMGTPIQIPADWRLFPIPFLARLRPFLPKPEQGASWVDAGASARRVAYSVRPTRAAARSRPHAAATIPRRPRGRAREHGLDLSSARVKSKGKGLVGARRPYHYRGRRPRTGFQARGHIPRRPYAVMQRGREPSRAARD